MASAIGRIKLRERLKQLRAPMLGYSNTGVDNLKQNSAGSSARKDVDRYTTFVRELDRIANEIEKDLT